MEKEVRIEVLARTTTRSHIAVVNMMMMTFLQTQCAARAKVIFLINHLRKWGQSEGYVIRYSLFFLKIYIS